MGSIVLEGERKAPVLSQLDRLRALKIGAGADDGTACSFFFGIVKELNILLNMDQKDCSVLNEASNTVPVKRKSYELDR